MTTALRIFSLAEAAKLPEPAPLVEGLLFANGYSALVGPSGVGKSFLAIALSVAVASGRPFFGRETVQGAVVYVAPEGFSTFRRRALAAIAAAGFPDLANLWLVPDPVYLHDAKSIAAFCAVLKERVTEAIGLIVFDTLSKCSAGMDENSNSDRELSNAGLDYIRKQTGAHALVLHHTGWNETRERGATALRAAVDTMLHLTREDDLIVLTATKQRDIESGETLRFALSPFDNSLVVTVPDAGHVSARLPDIQRKALEVLDGISLSEGIACTAWLTSSGLSESSFYRARRALVARGYVKALGRSKYAVSPEGRALLPTSTQLPRDSHGSDRTPASTTSSSRRLEVEGSSGRSPRVERGDFWQGDDASGRGAA